MSWFKKDKPDKKVKEILDGREVKYVTRRVMDASGTKREQILGKAGRIVVLDGLIKVFCGTTDVFISVLSESEYFLLLDGSGVTVKGFNTVINDMDEIVAYYTYYRK